MQVRPFLLALCCALALPACASADTMDSFHVTGHGLVLDFTLPASPVPDSSRKRDDFGLGDVTFTENGVSLTAREAYFYVKPEDGGFELDDRFGNAIDGLDFTGPKLFTGTVKHPTFKEGTFRLTDGPACSVSVDSVADAAGGKCHYTLDIAPVATATPEPSSLVLLGSGVLGAAGWIRRRLTA